MLLKISWRNIWRNKLRSIVVITAIAIGLWAGIFASAFVQGMMLAKVDNLLSREISHVQIHHPEFREELKIQDSIKNVSAVSNWLDQNDQIVQYASRVICMPMISSPYKSGVIKLVGVEPDKEELVTEIPALLKEGNYFETKIKRPIVISQSLAEDYKIKLNSKLVITTNDVEEEITSAAFRVVGIFHTGNPMFDDFNAFVRIEQLQQILGINNNIHEIAFLSQDYNSSDAISSSFNSKFSENFAEPWLDIVPGMRFMMEAQNSYTVVILSIILFALLFSIVNTMLMAVLERYREIGMLMAVGMSRMRIFFMILFETVLLTLVGLPVGLFISWSFIKFFNNVGIDLGNAAYQDFGFENIVYPFLPWQSYIMVSLMVCIMALIASIYPARKAIKLNPVEAIRKI